MADNKDIMAMLVLSCDKYSDLWDDFFNLRDKFWPDCPYKWYVVTESKDYSREGVEIIKCGSDLNWAGRFRKAVIYANTPYIGLYLEDYFISETVDTRIIERLLQIMEENNVTLINTSDVFYRSINQPNKQYFAEHLIKIPNNMMYGISTESAIWEKNYLLEKIGDKDYSAWQFEIDRCNEARSEKGFGGLNLCDERMPFHVSIDPVVIQGKFYPRAKKYFKKKGYEILSQRECMSAFDVFKYDMKVKLSKAKHGRKFLKWVGRNVFGIKFFTEG